MAEIKIDRTSTLAKVAIFSELTAKALSEFEADLHQHIHLENNILFPRAMAMEPPR